MDPSPMRKSLSALEDDVTFGKLFHGKAPDDYSGKVETWVHLFRDLNLSIKRMYEMCGEENLAPFTDGVIDTLQHSLDEFRSLRASQTSPSQMDIQDGEGTLDGELLRQLVDEEHMQPASALVLMVRERAEVAEDYDEDVDDLPKTAEKRSYSYSPRRAELFYSIKEKLETQEKPSPEEVKRRQEEKQMRAALNRGQIESQRLEDAAKRARLALERKERLEVIAEEKLKQIELKISCRQTKAGTLYEAHLSQIRYKAKNENTKLSEIAFLNKLQAESKKMTIDSKIEVTRERKRLLLESRKQKLAGRSIRDEEAGKRRQALLDESRSRLMLQQQTKIEEAKSRRTKILEERKIRAEELSRKPSETRLARMAKAKEKSPPTKSEQEETGSEWETESASSNEEEQAKLQFRDSESTPSEFQVRLNLTRAHKGFQRIRTKESKPVVWCSVCNLVLPDSPQAAMHLQEEKHYYQLDSEVVVGNVATPLVHFSRADSQELKVQRDLYLKKRSKKVKLKAQSKAYKHENICMMGRESSSPNKNRLQKLGIDLERCVMQSVDFPGMEGVIKDTIKLLDQRKEADLHIMRQLKFVPCCLEVVKKVWSVPKHEIRFLIQSLDSVTKLLTIFSGLSENRTYFMITNRLVPLTDLVLWLLSNKPKAIASVTFFPQLFHLLTIHLKHRLPSEYEHFREEYLEYLICSGLLPALKQKIRYLQGPIDLNANNVSLILIKSIGFLEALTTFPGWGLARKPAFEATTYLPDHWKYVFHDTEMVAIPYLLICILLHEGPPKQQTQPKVMPQSVLSVTILSFRFLNNMARLDLDLLQRTLCSDEYLDQIFHIFSYLLLYCTSYLDTGPEDVRELLHELILQIGYFATLSAKNQDLLSRGETCVLQRLCALPIAYFTDKKLTNVLFPTLIAACYEHQQNLDVLQHEMSADMLLSYITAQVALYPEQDIPEEEGKADDRLAGRSISSEGSSKSILAAASQKLVFPKRFPRMLWEKAARFFEARIEK